ncbi:YeeE/YedE family protein [Anaerovorax odorimutans]|uniref:YeeE/YedE family protein n=1 Tax=Anaerovorax odorimutans TaxID=109327 RepID=A0ABT1RJP5_9FIRM|nr:YeeE/YedE thiosulfate transporter family protein [Anaerovorax odorimutans]MCQ4635397.1 YeeE/YedE family protein [Anaerovorax odorimutans]
MVKLHENERYKKIIASPFSYLTGAVLLGILNIVHYIMLESGWSVTGAFFYFEDIWKNLSGTACDRLSCQENAMLAVGPNIRNLGLLVGALISVFTCARFKIKGIRSTKQVIAAAAGGLLMGYGAGTAGGCNISAFFTAAASLSLSAWIFLIFLFAGAFVGVKLLYKFL